MNQDFLRVGTYNGCVVIWSQTRVMTTLNVACLLLLFVGFVLATHENAILSFNDTNYQELMSEKRAVILCFHPCTTFYTLNVDL